MTDPRGRTIIAARKLKWVGRCVLLGAICAIALHAATISAHAATPQDPSNPVHMETSQQLFATVGALYAAGFDRQPNTPSADPLVMRFRSLKGPATDALRQYLTSHSTGDSVYNIARYVTFALIAGPPPKFDPTLRRDDFPPEVIALDGFRDVLADFYREANMEQIWREFQGRYQQSQIQLRDPLSRAVLLSSAYLREFAQPGRKFNVYVEPLVGGQIHVRNIGDEYALVVNPAVTSLDDMRHAYLHFLLDPLIIRYRELLLPEDVLYRIALRAPRLQESLRRDSLAFFSECLVHAVELRIRKLTAAKLTAEINQSEDDGLVLVASLMPALAKFEAVEPSISNYFPDLLKSIDSTSERVRLQAKRFPPADAPQPAPVEPQLSEKDRAIDEGDRLTASRDAAGAAAAYGRALAIAPMDPRALYGTAVVSLMQGQGEKAFDLFNQVISAAASSDAEVRPDAATLAWAHVYMGRLHDLASEREEAIAEYRSALTVSGAPEAARAAAQKGVDEAYQPAARNPSPG
jgi:tetratricopeptide (TPR) repeat protein